MTIIEVDKELIAKIANGDQAAFVTLQSKYKSLIKRTATRQLTKGGLHKQLSINYLETLEDIVSIVWAEFWQRIRIDPANKAEKADIANPRALIMRIAKFRAIDLCRKSIKNRQTVKPEKNTQNQPTDNPEKEKPQGKPQGNLKFKSFDIDVTHHELMAIAVHGSTLENAITKEQELSFVMDFLMRQPAQKRQVIELIFADTPKARIAEETGLSISTIRNIKKAFVEEASAKLKQARIGAQPTILDMISKNVVSKSSEIY